MSDKPNYDELIDSIQKATKDNDPEIGAGAGCLLGLVLLGLAFGMNLLFCLTVWLYYGWFIEPVTAFKIPFYCVIGAAGIVWIFQGRLMMAQKSTNTPETKTSLENLSMGFGLAIAQLLAYGLSMGFGWLYYIMFV